MAEHGHEAPSHNEHSAQNIVGGGIVKTIADAMYKTIDGIITPVAKLPQDAIEGVGEVVDQGARLGLKKSGGGGGGGHH